MINCCHCLQTIGARPVVLPSEHLAAAEATPIIATTCARATFPSTLALTPSAILYG